MRIKECLDASSVITLSMITLSRRCSGSRARVSMPGKFVAYEDREKAMLTEGKENKGEENKAPASDSKSASAVKNADGTPAADTANTEQDNKLAKLEKADIGMLSDAELEDGIRLATASEKYQLAIKFRDELKGRKAGE